MIIILINLIKTLGFLKFKSNWLIKDSNFELIEEYLINKEIDNEIYYLRNLDDANKIKNKAYKKKIYY